LRPNCRGTLTLYIGTIQSVIGELKFRAGTKSLEVFHSLSGRFNACPHAPLSPPEPNLQDHGIVGMMDRNLVQVEVREGREEAAHQSIYCLSSIHNCSKGRYFVTGMPKRRHGCGHIVGNSLRLNMRVDDRFAASPDALCRCDWH
jgi:hypothetical protein